ncbi:MAG: VanZ family protein, partial [Desulfovibrionales bacterium]|nr:VanZ family protein [Desulfovibrionales bacterium]
LGMWTILGLQRHRYQRFLLILMLALGTEMGQCFIDGRIPLVRDVWFNLAGGGLGCLGGWGLHAFSPAKK